MSDQPERIPSESPNATGQFLVHQQFFGGVLPPPMILEQYRQMDPSFPERFLAMAEQEQAHGHKLEMERQLVDAQVSRELVGLERLGIFLAFGVVAIFAAAGIWLGLGGHDWLAGAVFGTSMVSIVGLFLRQPQKEKSNPKGSDSSTE